MNISVKSLYWFHVLTMLCGLSARSAHPDCRMEQLPKNLYDWITVEQTHIDDVQYSEKSGVLVSDPRADSPYLPETRIVFQVKSYWISSKKLHVFEGQGLDPHKGDLEMKIGENKYYRLFVHPEAEKLYRDLVKDATPASPLCATPSSSHRTLLIWKEDGSMRPFFGKLSVDKVLGGRTRTLPSREVVRSLGINEILAMSRPDFPQSFSYIPEVLGLVPRKKLDRGMIIRSIPEDLLDGSHSVVPLYALYGHSEKHSPLLVSMLKKTNYSTRTYLTEFLIRPFIQQWIQIAVGQGFVPEAHGQNTLLGIKKDGLLSGEFTYRDLFGFAIDLSFRAKMGLPTPDSLPFVRSIKYDYLQSRTEKRDRLTHSIRWFMNVLNIINIYISSWVQSGQIPADASMAHGLQEIMFNEFNGFWHDRGDTSEACHDLRCIVSKVELERKALVKCHKPEDKRSSSRVRAVISKCQSFLLRKP